ncbi:cobyric acid synthase [Nitriliruptor alkaliphilus]|uniref:cobyric acid synthase n=1 Tax=Nitriliruptor alkaliphilus TaxID=427918 RepID=UPI00069654DF|nr:cobyric acid synthase [Nitriliruptor alkaliphilus]
MSGALLVTGTASDAGKSVVVAGLCRWLAREGVRVAPFKSQNMALNSAVADDGAEIGRAQAAQAEAAGVPSEAAMNPILIKPTGERHSQIVVMGRPAFDAGARDYHTRRGELFPIVLDALADLRRRHDVVICEGAGSPAEINLRPHDVTNMGLARAADLPVLIVGDIDRGGVFAALYGCIGLLEPADQALVTGTIINRFRGDPGVLAPGVQQLEQLTGRPNLGVLPHLDGLWLDAEDSLATDRGVPTSPPLGDDVLDVAVLRLPRSSNVTDVDALAAEPGVQVRFTTDVADVDRADLVVVPGTKNTVVDLGWLRVRGLDVALQRRAAAGRPILGICGGYQLFGRTIHDEVESRVGTVDGLGLLPVTTRFVADKLLATRTGTSPRYGTDARGYEIRHGRVEVAGGDAWLAHPDGTPEGCVVGHTFGTSWHGVFVHDGLRRALLGEVAAAAGRAWVPGTEPFAAVRARHLDRLGDLVADHLDAAELRRILDHGPRRHLPVVAPGGAPTPAPIPEPA